jgi:hypothetical protein
MRNTAETQKKHICKSNEISLCPKDIRDIRPIPVYETDGYTSNLEQTANDLFKTEIQFSTDPHYDYVPAYFKNFKDKKIITVVASRYCEARFFAAKELMHCFVFDEDSATNTVAKTNALIDDLSHPFETKENSAQALVDDLAWVGAAEFLIPEEWVLILKNAINDLCNQGVSKTEANLYVAMLIRVPVGVLLVRLHSDD